MANLPIPTLSQETDRRQGDRSRDAITESGLQVEGRLKSWQEGVWQRFHGCPIESRAFPLLQM